jgi:hypothetical protein
MLWVLTGTIIYLGIETTIAVDLTINSKAAGPSSTLGSKSVTIYFIFMFGTNRCVIKESLHLS